VVSFLVNRELIMPVAKPPSALSDHLGYWLRMVSNAVSQSFARKVEAQGVTVAEWVVLRVLFDHDGIAPSLLAEHMGMTKGAISKLADRLGDKGLISREVSDKGGRGHSLVLTTAGRRLVPRLARLADDNDAAFFQTLSDRERLQLEAILRKIASARAPGRPPTD
jgi:DNA-binding MarR family transcriptional regulator